MARFIGILLFLGIGFLAGLLVGYQYWRPESAIQPAVETALPDVVTEAGAYASPAAPSQNAFERLEQEAIAMMSAMRYQRALELLMEADLVAGSEEESRQLASLFEETVKLRVTQLQSLNRMADIDALYEQLTLSMPERAEYYILLAEHRIAMDNADRALPVLAQIENHHQLGGRARELIASIANVNGKNALAVIPLTSTGNQFTVKAIIDETSSVTLMLDTGASMTVLAPALLERLGYTLKGRQANFSTANGVVAAPIVELESLSLAGVRVEPLRVGALGIALGRDRDRRGVDGLLGMDFLGQFEFSVDQDASELRLISRRAGN